MACALLLGSSLWLAGCGSDPETPSGFLEPTSLRWAEQGWTDDERERWHHLNSGQQFAPLNWLKALRVPGTDHHFLDNTFLRELGFMPKAASVHNPEALPVGFS